MSTPVDDNKQVNEPKNAASGCDASCSCNSRGLSSKAKLGICLLVALAAVVVVVAGSANKARTAASLDSFATASTAQTPAASVSKTPAIPAVKQTQNAVWGPTLSSFASLNEIAADKDNVFVFVPAKDEKQTAAIKTQVEAAVTKSQARGSATFAYTLSNNAKEYEQITRDVGAPCVMVMAKGAGAVPVSGEITEAKLLEALVTASRPSSCGPSGCAPSTPGCN